MGDLIYNELELTSSSNRLDYYSDKHSKLLLESLYSLKKRKELCDVVLIVGKRKILCHRVILSACSPYFHAMFRSELQESRQTEVEIKDIDEHAMELLVEFAYTTHIVVEEGKLMLFYVNLSY